MDRALRHLLLLRLRGGFRHRVRQLAGPAGMVSFAVVAAIVWLLLTTDWYTGSDAGGAWGDPQRLREGFLDFMPLALLAATVFTVLMSAGSPLYFAPEEINFLLAGPFTRRGILAYKFLVYAFGALVNAAIIALVAPPRGSLALATFAGAASTLLFIQLASTTLLLCLRAIRARAAVPWRRVGVALVVLFGSALLWGLVSASGEGLVETLRTLRRHWTGEAVLAPFLVFVRVFLARELWPELLLWLGLATAINVALVYAIFWLDRYSGEPASRRRVRWGSRVAVRERPPGRKAAGRWRAPVFYGLGPVAWRQLINAVRGGHRVILVWVALAAVAGPLMALNSSADSLGVQAGIVFFAATYVLPKTLLLDFRADLGSMEIYKALPLRGWQIFAGQVVVAAAVASLIESTLAVGFLLGLGGVAAWWYGVAVLSIVLFNVAFFALENIVFLLLPSRPVPVGRVDFEFMGRTVAEYFGKALIIVAVVAAALASGLAVLTAAGTGIVLPLLVSWFLVAAFAAGLVVLGGLAFRRFNVSEAID